MAVTIQQNFRGRNDDGDLSDPAGTGASWIAAEGADWEQEVNAKFRVRFKIEETDGVPGSALYQLHYSHNGGGYAELVDPASDVIQAVASDQAIADEDPVTERLLTQSDASWVDGLYDETGATATMITLDDDETELEFCLIIGPADVSDGDTIGLRVYDAVEGALDAYIDEPIITVRFTSSSSSLGFSSSSCSSASCSCSCSSLGFSSSSSSTPSSSSSVGFSSSSSSTYVAGWNLARANRFALLNFGEGDAVLPAPHTTITQGDRAHLLGLMPVASQQLEGMSASVSAETVLKGVVRNAA